ncbi:MAG: S-adenosyl-l-methionine hydroxide adenosyltransferase family protein [Oscillospiraceae bacterium]|nr:S-adenosyl-l-methionine hydroxide adenosyltransferase family protein [Oscillospiraceae bacterium]
MKPLVLQSDFGLADGAVSAMYGVAVSLCPDLKIYDLTHDIEPYNIWDAGYRLLQAAEYWPQSTVFVSVVDPGVGSARKSIAVRTAGGHYVITPDNGTVTFLDLVTGIEEARIIDEGRNRRPDSEQSYTFYGRDVYAYTGAKLAAGLISFEEVGEPFPVEELVRLHTDPPYIDDEGGVCGTVDVLDVRFGSLWTNIPREMFTLLGFTYGDRAEVTITYGSRTYFRNSLPYSISFSDVMVGEQLIYVNSLDRMAIAINQGSFAKAYNIGSGEAWKIRFKKTM